MRVDIRARAASRAAALVMAVVALAACAGDDGRGGTGATVSTAVSNRSSTSAGATTTTAVASAPVAARGSYAVGRRTHTFVDSSRPTAANGMYPGAPERTLLTTIWYPATGPARDDAAPVADAPSDTEHGPYPLILMSHGYLARGVIYEKVAKQWASAGYVVAAPDYPLSNTNAPGRPVVTDTKNQPADASFVIDQVIAGDDELLGGIVDRDRIGAAGHSLGAITTFGLAYSDCCRDDRIDAAIAMAGATILVDAPSHYFNDTTTPLLSVHGDADRTVPYRLGESAWERANPPKLLVTFAGGQHVFPYLGGEDAQAEAFYEFTAAFFDRYVKGDDGALERVHEAVANPEAKATLREER
jgi:dienelactone hydrolase